MYFSIDDILAGEERVPFQFQVGPANAALAGRCSASLCHLPTPVICQLRAVGLGHLDPSQGKKDMCVGALHPDRRPIVSQYRFHRREESETVELPLFLAEPLQEGRVGVIE